MYVSASTLGLLITVSPGGYSQAFDVSSGSPLCTSGSPRTCTIAIPAPVGADTFTLTEYDAVPVNGSIPNGAHALATSTLNQTIVANTANTLTFYADGIIAGVATSGGTTFGSLPADGSAHSYGVVLVNTDADGNVISTTSNTPYNNPITVTLSETGGSGHAYLVLNGANVGSSATIAQASDTLSLHYDGGGSSGYTTSTSFASSGASGTTLRVSPLYVTGSLAATDASQTNTASITEASAPSNVAYTTSWACSGFSKSLTGSGASGSFAVTSPAATAGSTLMSSYSCSNATISDNYGSSVSVPVSASIPVVSTCSSQSTNVYLNAKNGSGQYEVGSGSSCNLSISASNMTLYYPPNDSSHVGSGSFTVSEANDMTAPTVSGNTCSSGVASVSPSLSGGASYTSNAGGSVSVATVPTTTTSVTSCTVTVSDRITQAKPVAMSLNPTIIASSSNSTLTVSNGTCALINPSRPDFGTKCAMQMKRTTVTSFTAYTNAVTMNYSISDTGDGYGNAELELEQGTSYWALPTAGTVTLPNGAGTYTVIMYACQPAEINAGPYSDTFYASGDIVESPNNTGSAVPSPEPVCAS